ncbi:MAG: LysE family transporter [Sulfurospirillaceae bacterium]|nr:LysE family transporter [Sulfurospirillaceae bacterium]MDD2827733.1 LysE family transporter [Sulfurospirillaceae bacterium]
MNLDIWLTMLLAAIAISVSPGAGAVVSMNYGLRYGLKRSYAAIFGLQLGLLTQTFIVVIGLGSLIAQSLILFSIIKWVGVAYLVFLGVMKFIEKPMLPHEEENIKVFSAKKAFIQAALINLTNIKATVFLVAFIPQFLDPHQSLWGQFSIICATLVGVDIIVMTGYSSLASKLKFMVKSLRAITIQNRITGSFLLLAALFVSTANKS